MKNSKSALLILGLFFVVAFAGCSKNYVITTDLEEQMTTPTVISVGPILDELPAEIEPTDRPSAEDIEKLKGYLRDEVEKRGDLNLTAAEGDEGAYEIRGSLLDYKKGSGALRFFIGFGAGKAKMTVGLQLVDKATDQVIFAGNFYGEVAGGLTSGTDMFRQVARDFTKQLEKQVKARMES